jgi:hypothetical protein
MDTDQTDQIPKLNLETQRNRGNRVLPLIFTDGTDQYLGLSQKKKARKDGGGGLELNDKEIC